MQVLSKTYKFGVFWFFFMAYEFQFESFFNFCFVSKLIFLRLRGPEEGAFSARMLGDKSSYSFGDGSKQYEIDFKNYNSKLIVALEKNESWIFNMHFLFFMFRYSVVAVKSNQWPGSTSVAADGGLFASV